MGWDAFGLPAENAAIKNNRPPREWTLENIARMKKTHSRFAFSYDWDREITTCEPDYYRWNQWFFLKMLENGLAYRKKALVNWCSLCATVLANEQVVDGCCWRHESTPVEQRALEQWFLRITAYADQLLDDMKQLEGNWPDRFRCIVSHDGVFEQRMMYYSTEELWFPEWEFGGPYYDNPQSYEQMNPATQVTRWHTPMLVIHGEQDFRIPYSQGLAAFTALQRRGIESRLLVFPDENHWVLKPANSVLWYRTVLDWLDAHLKN